MNYQSHVEWFITRAHWAHCMACTTILSISVLPLRSCTHAVILYAHVALCTLNSVSTDEEVNDRLQATRTTGWLPQHMVVLMYVIPWYVVQWLRSFISTWLFVMGWRQSIYQFNGCWNRITIELILRSFRATFNEIFCLCLPVYWMLLNHTTSPEHLLTFNRIQ